jgi:cytolysin (calcineurin-like family phosphatase)
MHSSWDWGGVHFVNLNLYPGGLGAADKSLAFLVDDLAQKVGSSHRPVILFHHYGFDAFSCEDRWWTEPERETYYAAIKDYNVIAIFNGHLHSQGHLQWHGLDAFIAGKAADGNFLVVHITADRMTVAGRTQQGWRECWKKAIVRTP